MILVDIASVLLSVMVAFIYTTNKAKFINLQMLMDHLPSKYINPGEGIYVFYKYRTFFNFLHGISWFCFLCYSLYSLFSGKIILVLIHAAVIFCIFNFHSVYYTIPIIYDVFIGGKDGKIMKDLYENVKDGRSESDCSLYKDVFFEYLTNEFYCVICAAIFHFFSILLILLSVFLIYVDLNS